MATKEIRRVNWLVAFRTSKGKTKVVKMAGGLHEAEALRCAYIKASKADKYIRFQSISELTV